MKIEAEFDIGQEVYYIATYYNDCDDYFREIGIGEIENITLAEGKRKLYLIDGGLYYKEELFSTREEAEKRLEEMENKYENHKN